MDIMTFAGFQLLLQLTLRLRPGGVLWLAWPCASFVRVARNGTGRTKAHSPL